MAGAMSKHDLTYGIQNVNTTVLHIGRRPVSLRLWGAG